MNNSDKQCLTSRLLHCGSFVARADVVVTVNSVSRCPVFSEYPISMLFTMVKLYVCVCCTLLVTGPNWCTKEQIAVTQYTDQSADCVRSEFSLCDDRASASCCCSSERVFLFVTQLLLSLSQF